MQVSRGVIIAGVSRHSCSPRLPPRRYGHRRPVGWCDYLVCDPIACPQETSAVERWRKVRARRQHAADAAGSLPESSLDLDADIDPEDGSEEWI